MDPFAGVRVGDGIAAHVTAGSAQSLRVIGDSNIVPNIMTQTEPTLVTTVGGSVSVPVLRVWLTQPANPTIPSQVVITVPSLSYVRAEDGAPVEVNKAEAPAMRIEGFTGGEVTLIGPGGPYLEAVLSDASLDAGYYPVALAWVELSGESRADLDSSGPVTGAASGSSVVDNMLGSGPCLVTTTGSARTSCH